VSIKNIIEFQGNKPQIDKSAFIMPQAVLIGKCIIGEKSSIWPNTTLRADIDMIKIGKFTNIQDGSTLHMSHECEYSKSSICSVGDYVTIGHNVILHGCQIDSESLVGMGSVVLDNAIVPKQCLVGAGSLVPNGKVLESGFLYVGSPVKKIRPLKPKEIEFFKYSALHYTKLANSYLGH
jgi:carbonic anhydrase/acetyltransferase-like protein (isoleucine patch superfamily)